ncbi:2-polyprenyl-6-methoxyphenol hydroxylase-like FAD-dependent oxidoreductase [Wenyingzhuangia heitensis]|uniref:2-polyprenyl-6-methoxyphenol hydroxylase-like FAD-dependent oxidoreductase n=1 Tax=Wenyingzhuangia heitensis TaxID=1487859 RepID=A0ABX0UBF0_9FLAO|nr:FAD-dependent monooxygenase [Wenyingzhuangia heitensis]NIJ46058.1 2-polyprenyl-6-methoxyphenol hydroxylase-like FAD-dependent oxidoreductase [Wenyingzhuangia heitensis]
MMIIDIIGGGIGGLTTGIFLKRKGFNVRVFEQTKEVRSLGAGIILANNAMQVYQKLNLSDKITAQGSYVSSVKIVDEKLETISETDLSVFESKYQLKNIAIHRGKLQRILMDEFESDELFLDHQLKGIKKKSNGCLLKFNNDKDYNSEVVIGADGIHSKVRQLLFESVKIRKAQQICWRGVLNYNLPEKYSHQAVESWGKGVRFGFVKINDQKVYWYALKSIHKYRKQNININDFKVFDSLVADIISKTDEKNIHTAEIMDIAPFKNWSVDCICLLGDAAHATTPNLGQGACQAIEDAFVLAECIEKHHILKAFKEYEKLRIKKAHKIVLTSYKIGTIAHWSNSLLVWLRNRIVKTIPLSIQEKQMEAIFKLVII